MPWRWFIVVSMALVVACESPVSPPGLLVPAVPPVDTSIRVPIGGSAQVTVGLDTPVTDVETLDGFVPYRLQLVHVIASEPMKAIVRVVSDTETDARPADWRILNRCCSLSWQSIHQVVVTFPAATDLMVALVIPERGPAETFTVSTWRVDP